jgi:Kae1-associated kinase Bud32
MVQKKILAQGAEAKIYLLKDKIIKSRIPKSYRLKEIDDKIRKLRTRSETKLLLKASKVISAPIPLESNDNYKIIIPFIGGKKLSQELDNFTLKQQVDICKQIGKSISKLHKENLIHGDLTTSNMIYVEQSKLTKTPNKKFSLGNNRISAKNSSEAESKAIKYATKGSVYFIDFGLGFQNGKYEDKAVDLHVLKQALEAKHFTNWEKLWKAVELGYLSFNKTESQKVLERLKAVEKRGRYKH